MCSNFVNVIFVGIVVELLEEIGNSAGFWNNSMGKPSSNIVNVFDNRHDLC